MAHLQPGGSGTAQLARKGLRQLSDQQLAAYLERLHALAQHDLAATSYPARHARLHAQIEQARR